MKNEQKQKTQTQWGGRRRRPPHWICVLCFCSFIFYSMNIYGYIYIYMDIPYIFHIYFLLVDMFHVFSIFQLHFGRFPTEYRIHSTFAETLTRTAHATTNIEFPKQCPPGYPLPVRTLLKGVRPSRQAHLQCPVQVHGTCGYTGGVQHPVEWQATHTTGACPRP